MELEPASPTRLSGARENLKASSIGRVSDARDSPKASSMGRVSDARESPKANSFGRVSDAKESSKVAAEASRSNAPGQVVLPPGSFGAGGWSPSTKYAGKGPRLSAEQCVKARKVFRELLIKHYQSVIRAWRDLDENGDGRLSLYEFMRGCRKLGVSTDDPGAKRLLEALGLARPASPSAGQEKKATESPSAGQEKKATEKKVTPDRDHPWKRLWEALDADRSGFITLQEVDDELARLLGSLAVCVWSAAGTVGGAWSGYFNVQGKIRISQEEFAKGCRDVGFPGNPEIAFNALIVDGANFGLSRKEFGFLELWFAQNKDPISPLHDGLEPVRGQKHFPDATVLPARPPPKLTPAPKKEFKALLIKSYGTIARAWRLGLDRDHNGILDWKEFQRACADVGYAGNRRELWDDLDANKSGGVSLRELDEPCAHMLEALLCCVRQRFHNWKDAWAAVMDKRGNDRVERQTFIQGCGVLGYGGNADRLFELLDMDRVNYLSFDLTGWIEGAERADSKEPLVMTRSMQRLLDSKARDNRVRSRRARDTPGSPTSPRSPRTESRAASPAGTRRNSELIARVREFELAEAAKGLPEWFQSMEAERKLKEAPLQLSRTLSSTQSRRRRQRPLSPWSPGRGGWPSSRLLLTDTVWGGSTPTATATNFQAATSLLHAAVSEPNLAKWQSSLKG